MTKPIHPMQLYQPTPAAVWQGRIDSEEGEMGMRFHQKVLPLNHPTSLHPQQPGLMLFGFASDEGVRRNKGRTGAAQAPDLVRHALANMAWHHDARPALCTTTTTTTTAFYDGGNVHCADRNLAASQQTLAHYVAAALSHQHKVIVFGGGHEMAWGSFQGLAQHLHSAATATANTAAPNIGIVNFDAHFDLRSYSTDNDSNHSGSSSGSPFLQIADHCEQLGWPFHYACLGVSRASNTQALFATAETLGVMYREDRQLATHLLATRISELEAFIAKVEHLYLTIDIDVFSAGIAPGVSAPAARGLSYEVVETLLQPILNAKNAAGNAKLVLADLAEYNPNFDIDNQTARLVARLAWEISRAMLADPRGSSVRLG